MSNVALKRHLAPDTGAVSQSRRTWNAFRRHTLATAGLGVALIFVVVAVLASQLTPYDPAQPDLANVLAGPSLRHPMGTDDLGRDILSRVIVGSRVSLSVAAIAVTILIVIGVFVGTLAGYYRSLDGPIMRIVDVMMSVPNTFLILTIVALFGPGLRNTMLVIGLTSWMGTARLVRGEFLSLRERDFVEAARAIGASNRRIIIRHMIPNTVSVIVVQATLFISYAVITESLLSFLGLGAQPPTPSWGNILSNGRNFMRDAWWMTVFPGLAIFVTVMAFNFIGDGLRDAFDPRRTKM